VSRERTASARFDTVLVANRGEIAARVIATAAAEGYRTVAVHSDADADAPHVRAADVAVAIGPAPATASYLDVDRIVDAARRTGAGAIHPGYGFLSENPALADACAEAGIVFVGPPADAIRLMGDKAAAKRRMREAGVPLLAGHDAPDASDDELRAAARELGVPLMVKAAAGGGGKGMRLVAALDDLDDALVAARREAASAFGSDALILERALTRPRHVEIQVLADAHGHVIALGERDCSVQRRHQKVVEEAPSPAVDADLRERMQRAAVAAARDIGYVGAGTVEFLLDADGTFAFLEMNTRLQVEHPVTELVTGLDLVAWQLRIAQGEPLTIAQDEVVLHGHAIEARLYAEDPDAGYLPQTGRLTVWSPPSGPGVRVDAGVETGTVVTAHYDPMLAKVVAHGRDRDQARRRLADALDRLVVLGVTTNRAFLARAVRHPTFATGEATTAFLDEAVSELRSSDDGRVAPAVVAAVAAWLHDQRAAEAEARSPGLAGWSSSGTLTSRQRLVAGDVEHDVVVTVTADGTTVAVDGADHTVARDAAGLVVDGTLVRLDAVRVDGGDRVLAHTPGADLDLTDVLLAPPAAGTRAGAGVLSAPMHGAVVAVEVAEGDTVTAGDRLVVLEAMKMEHAIVADVAGRVTELAGVGAQVATGDVLARIEPHDAAPGDEPGGAGPGE
jgi:geranyl-CoA carboxylase alpha subunit